MSPSISLNYHTHDDVFFYLLNGHTHDDVFLNFFIITLATMMFSSIFFLITAPTDDGARESSELGNGDENKDLPHCARQPQ